MSEPKRIQLRRTKGWRKPEGAVIVARPSKWGNPYSIGAVVHPLCMQGDKHTVVIKDAAEAVEWFGLWLDDYQPDEREPAPSTADIVIALRGHDLACWCPLDAPCHADVLLEVANR